MEKYLYSDLYQLEEKHFWHISKRQTVLDFIKRFNKKNNPKILDIGCGTGKNVETFSQIGSVWGIDTSSEAIKFCKKRGLINVKIGSAYQTNFTSKSIDIVTLLDVLEHIDEDKSLQEIYKILTKNGYLIITVPAFSFLWSKWDEVLHHKRRYTKKSLEETLRRNNFKIVKITYLHSFLVIPALVIRLIKNLIYRGDYPSDFKLSSPLINKIMLLLCFIERKLIFKFSLPFGTSLVCIAKKYEK